MKKDKSEFVNNIFSSVADDYDLMNNVMSFGIHHLWKDKFVGLISDYSKSLLDVAGGTGDIALRYYEQAQSKSLNPSITIGDINQDMLEVGRDKFIDRNILDGVNFVRADAQALPFDDMSFWYYTIAFGIRNVNDIQLALDEAYRVLKPGGKFMCLEFSKPLNKSFAKIYDFYSFKAVPFLGKIIANNQEAYQYLVDSIREFPGQELFSSMIKKAGFEHVNYLNLTNGIVAIHYGYKI